MAIPHVPEHATKMLGLHFHLDERVPFDAGHSLSPLTSAPQRLSALCTMAPKRLPPALQRKFYANRTPTLLCPFCPRIFRNLSGLSQHKNSIHPLAFPVDHQHAPQNTQPTATSTSDSGSTQDEPADVPVSPSLSSKHTPNALPQDGEGNPFLFRNRHTDLDGKLWFLLSVGEQLLTLW